MPSIVVTGRLPTAPTDRRHERTGLPSICTVQVPHCAMPQPYLVPVMPSTSRNTQSSGVPPSTSTSCLVPLTLIEKVMTFSRQGRATRPPCSRDDDGWARQNCQADHHDERQNCDPPHGRSNHRGSPNSANDHAAV